MIHEKIFKRADGSTVVVTVRLQFFWGHDGAWEVHVQAKPRRAKKVRFVGTARTKMDESARDWLRDNRKAVLAVVSQDEIKSVMRELVEQIKPVF